MRYLHTMVRVKDIDASLHFYCDLLGLQEVRRIDPAMAAMRREVADAADDAGAEQREQQPREAAGARRQTDARVGLTRGPVVRRGRAGRPTAGLPRLRLAARAAVRGSNIWTGWIPMRG